MNIRPAKKYFFCILLISLLILSANYSFALSIDSLKIQLAAAKEDTSKINLLIKICQQHGAIDEAEQLTYSENALTLSEKLNYPKGQVTALIIQGAHYSSTGDYNEGLKKLNAALKICSETLKNNELLSDVYSNIADCYYYQSNYTEALSFYLKSLSLLDKNDSGKKASTEFNISLIYFQNKKYAEAIDYTEKASNIFLRLKDTASYANSLQQLGNVFYEQKKYNEAINYFKQSLQYTEKLKDKTYCLPAYTGLSAVYNDLKKDDESMMWLKKAIAVSREANDQNSLSICLMNMGQVLTEQGKNKEAISYLQQSLELSKLLGTRNQTAQIYQGFSTAYKELNDFKEALKYHELYSGLNDSIFNEENSRQLNDLSVKYESEKKEKEIAVLNLELIKKQKDQEVLSAQIQKRNIIIYGTIAATLLLLLTMFLLFNRKQLLQKNHYQAEMSRQQENAANAVVQAQENEQSRIAKDLHDSVGTFLSTLRINLQSYEKEISSENNSGYQNALQLIDTIAQELRNVMKNLSSETLQEHGLVSALQELVSGINQVGVTHFDFYSHGMSERPDEIIELNLYRITQELLSNCVKYAKADHATLQLIAAGEHITLTLEDNGTGFKTTPAKPNERQGRGLKNMRDRVNFIKGTMTIESGAASGTLAVIEVPKKRNT